MAAKRGSIDERRQWLAEAIKRGDAGIDTTGDGMIDAVALDTVGDGQVDTVRPLDFAPERTSSTLIGYL